MRTLLGAAFAAACVAAQSADPDRDGDGLSDFHEVRKFGTDPSKRDSDGDGKPDGDREERREYAYTIRSVVRVMRPVHPAAMNDDFQDARVLSEDAESVEVEVIHYPFSNAGAEIRADPDWRAHRGPFSEFLKSGPTTAVDGPLAALIVRDLAAEGVDAKRSDDKALAERASAFLCARAKFQDGFTTFLTAFKDGRPHVPAELRSAFERELKKSDLTLEQQWDREILASGMYRNRVRGSCTSSAIYLCGCLRALGLPTRIVLCIPVVDASDAKQLDLVRERITDERVRKTILDGLTPLGRSWASHTFNEVAVGGRWRRLNYDKLGQGVLDAGLFGLMTHVATFRDWADAEMPKTVGKRQGLGRQDDVFGGPNPYRCLDLSDRVGAHARR